MKHNYIKQVFTNLKKLKEGGIFFSGIEGEGEFKRWDNNGKLWIHCFYKNDKLEGEYKTWYSSGRLSNHSLYKEGTVIKDYLKEGELVK